LVFLASCTHVEKSGPLAGFSGSYKIVDGADGVIEVRPTMGGTYTELRASFKNPEHENLVIIGKSRADGTIPVWRFEQDPAPNVSNEGSGRFQNNQLITEFLSKNDPDRKLLRETWKLRPSGQLEFTLEASTHNQLPRRVGGFVADLK
jgi:hypothetical protein